jgi:hypothetical protein
LPATGQVVKPLIADETRLLNCDEVELQPTCFRDDLNCAKRQLGMSPLESAGVESSHAKSESRHPSTIFRRSRLAEEKLSGVNAM